MVGVLVSVAAVASVVFLLVGAKEGRRWWRYRRVARELGRDDLRHGPHAAPLARDRPGVDPGAVPPLRPGESRDSSARVLAFHQRLAQSGRYLDELQITKRLN